MTKPRCHACDYGVLRAGAHTKECLISADAPETIRILGNDLARKMDSSIFSLGFVEYGRTDRERQTLLWIRANEIQLRIDLRTGASESKSRIFRQDSMELHVGGASIDEVEEKARKIIRTMAAEAGEVPGADEAIDLAARRAGLDPCLLRAEGRALAANLLKDHAKRAVAIAESAAIYLGELKHRM